ncbi:Uncharacterised protein [Porphyromonas macacae]|uniref:Uncharacterized protein n=1 Tax=Porphyromonas macacae TaxID=28115 RepID=A0A379E6T8_9PORP|nr:hypothetical protein [Porphyromonas macacae]SUB88376.1 Uncharacterised protein [Porphyromonas macacae]
MTLRKVQLVVSNQVVGGQFYHATSFPHRDRDKNGIWDIYNVPVYYLYIKGSDEKGRRISKAWRVLRFMPYWNDPSDPNPHYLQEGWVVAGLCSHPNQPVAQYKRFYRVHSAPSKYDGAIVIKNSFYIHAGPSSIPIAPEGVYGSAGCIEVIGNFYEFKNQIKQLSGSQKTADDAIADLVKQRKLYVEIEHAVPPNLINNLIEH